jgi:uncharacterized protein YdaL
MKAPASRNRLGRGGFRSLLILLVALLTGLPSASSPAQAKSDKKPAKSTSSGTTTNAFPSDHGSTSTVPQDRGKDKRPRSNGGGSHATAQTLILYDDDGPYGWLGELYAVAAGNLASHFGTWKAEPVSSYTAGELLGYAATIYIGSTYKDSTSPLPVAFLDDALISAKPLIWMYDNIWQLANRAPDFVNRYGFNPWTFDTSPIAEVRYKNASLTRYATNGGGILAFSSFDSTKALALAQAVRSDGSTLPWAVRALNLTYIGEIPFAYMSENDRYLIFSDLLFDALAPATTERHRALVRIEDIGPEADPAQLRAIADYLGGNQIPFTFIVYPYYLDPHGMYSGGVPESVRLRDAPEVVEALKYMLARGGTMVMHGFTHQYQDKANPYDAVSGNDFEFYLAHIDPATNNVVYDGPVPEDSYKWALGRLDAASKEFRASGLAQPTIFEFPHYAGSVEDYRAVASRFSTRYERALYFGGALGGKNTTIDYGHMLGQFFPYVVNDVYGSKVIPENIGNYEPQAYNNHPPRFPVDLIASARRNLVVRDGFASFFYHPYFSVQTLAEIVQGIKDAGYTFVSPSSL